MYIRNLIAALCCLAAFSMTALAQAGEAPVNRDPDKVRFVTSDIDNFWRAFDQSLGETDRAKKVATFQREYLDKGSAGLKDFVRLRIKSAADLVETVDKLPKFYASVRPSTLRVAEMEKEMRKSFRKFKHLYPDAAFPDVYFVIGVANTGGTASGSGLLIGAELYGLTPNTPRDEFPAWFRKFLPDLKDEKELLGLVTRALDTALKPVERLPSIVAHESCHFNQNYPKQTTLLEKSIQEGSCDLIAELTAGEVINPELKAYGDRNEAALWREFLAEMNGTDLSRWMYNGFKIKDRPGDLGYYVGYKITRAYYQNAGNKQQAISDILNIKDFQGFFRSSRYGENFLPAAAANAQQAGSNKIVEALERDGCVGLESGKVKVCKYDYLSDGLSVEAVSFRPAGEGPFPGVLLIPGYQRTALHLIPLGVTLAREGFAAVAVTQPGFGKSQGKADYVGPNTLKVLTEGFRRLEREPYVDARRLGIYGYSRGGMAASLLAVRLDNVRAAVFGAGIYDFRRAHGEVKIEGIRKNMESETGMTEEAIRQRSSILEMKNLKCPVLILHGEKDENVPVSQAILLRDKLVELKKEFEIKLYPDRAHSLGAQEVADSTLDFFKRKLAEKSGR